MSKSLKFLFLIALSFLAGGGTAIAQNEIIDCDNYHKKNCSCTDNKGFKYYGQSKSSIFTPGQISERKVVVYKGYDYYLSVCSHAHFYPVHFQIFEEKTPGNRTIVYDNEKYDYLEEVLFTNPNTRNIYIVISVPKNKKNDDTTLDSKDFFRECVGIQMMWRRTPKTGF